MQLVRGMIATEIVGEGYACSRSSQFFATSFQFIIKVNGLIGTLCLLFRHMVPHNLAFKLASIN
jgi:hypothetical protein